MEFTCYLSEIPSEMFGLIEENLDDLSRVLLSLTSKETRSMVKIPVKIITLQSIFHHAAREGSLSLLQWALQVNSDKCRAGIIRTLSLAFRYGHLTIVQYLLKNYPELKLRPSHIAGALTSGNLAMLEWLPGQAFELPRNSQIYLHAARSGNLDALLWAEKHFPTGMVPTRALEAAVKGGDVKVIAHLLSFGCPVTKEDLCLACRLGNIHLVLYLNRFVNVPPSSLLLAAITSRKRDVFEWVWQRHNRSVSNLELRTAAAHFQWLIAKELVEHASVTVMKRCFSALVKGALYENNRTALDALLSQWQPSGLANLPAMAVFADNVELYDWLCAHPALTTMNTRDSSLAMATQHGRLHFLDRILEKSTRPINVAVIVSMAIQFDRKDVIEWVIARGLTVTNLPLNLTYLWNSPRKVEFVRLLVRANGTFSEHALSRMQSNLYSRAIFSRRNIQHLLFLRDELQLRLPEFALHFLRKEERARLMRQRRMQEVREKQYKKR